MKWLAAALVVVGIAFAWFLWPHDEPASTPTVTTTKTPKRIDVGKRPDPKALAPATISGSVRDVADKPLAEATVCITQHRAHRCVKSGTDGRYVIDGVIANALTLGASLAKYQPKLVEVPTIDPNEQRTIEIVLDPGGAEITGVVEDILGGPIANAHASADGAHTDADDKGRFTLWVRARQQRPLTFVTAEADGYGPRTRAIEAPGKIVIALSPESTIAGRVVDAAGAPVAGARVVTRDADTTSGPDGTFALERLAAGKYPLAASAPGKYGAREQEVVLGVGERVENIEIRLSPARSVIATIDMQGDHTICAPTPSLSDWTFDVPTPWRDEAGRYHFDAVPPSIYSVKLGCGAEVPPLVVRDDDIEVTWRVDSGGVVKGTVHAEASRYMVVTLTRVGSSRRPSVTTSLESGFDFRGVPPGRYEIAAEIDRDSSTPPETIEVINGKTIEHDITVPARPKFRLSGTVVDENRRPVTSGMAKITSALGPRTAVETPVTNGKFEALLTKDMYNVEVRSGDARGWATTTLEGNASVDVTVKADMAKHDMAKHDTVEREPRWDDRYTLWGRVVDAQRVPVSGAIVSVVDAEADLHTTTDAAGKFRFVSKFSQHAVRVYRVGGGNAETVVRADQPTEIVLGVRESITGTAVRPDGQMAIRFFVRVGEFGDAYTATFDHTGGRFAIEDKHTYPLRLAAVINGIEGEAVIITPQSPKTNVILKLPRTVEIRGRIVDATTHAPIPNVRVHGRQSLDGWAPWFTHADQVTDAEGRFAMRELPPGRMMLEILPSLDTWATQTFQITVPDTSGSIEELGLARVRK